MSEVCFKAHRAQLDVYGIKRCDTCRRAMRWLEIRKVPAQFHDFRVELLTRELLQEWLHSDFAPYLINRRSTTWRGLSREEQEQAHNPIELLLEHPTLIKRPVFMLDGHVIAVGFAPLDLEDYI